MTGLIVGLLLIALNVAIGLVNDLTWWTVIGAAGGGITAGTGMGVMSR